MDLGIRDVDSYFEMRAPGLRRKSLKDVAERLRSLMRHLHRTGRTAADQRLRRPSPRAADHGGSSEGRDEGLKAAPHCDARRSAGETPRRLFVRDLHSRDC
jgi:hypothetical protein